MNLQTLLKGAKAIAEKGGDFLDNVQEGFDVVKDSASRSQKNLAQKSKAFFGNVGEGVDTVHDWYTSTNQKVDKLKQDFMTKDHTLGKIADGTHQFFSNTEGGRDLRTRARDESAKASLRGTSNFLASSSRGTRRLDNLHNRFDDSFSGPVKSLGKNALLNMVPGYRALYDTNKLTKNITGNSLFETASRITEKGSEFLDDKANFIDTYDAETITSRRCKERSIKSYCLWSTNPFTGSYFNWNINRWNYPWWRCWSLYGKCWNGRRSTV